MKKKCTKEKQKKNTWESYNVLKKKTNNNNNNNKKKICKK
jgi:hypothetical protein